MRIGILTLVNQLNYGGVLQAYALQRFLLDQGYSADLIDYWLMSANEPLLGFCKNPNIRLLKKFYTVLQAFRRLDIPSLYFYFDERRRFKTQQFIRNQLRMSEVCYKNYCELKEIKGYDCIVVGSDQVWNPKYNPNPFLLSQVSSSIRKISYAASFGVKELPENRMDEYANAWKAFHAISVREQEGLQIVSRATSAEATWVVDPVLLLSCEQWLDICQQVKPSADGILCYWLGDINKILPYLHSCSQRTGYRIKLYTNLGNIPSANRWQRQMWLLAKGKYIQCCYDAGPLEFLAAIRDCKYIVSDSFHAFMFACVFRKHGYFFTNTAPGRLEMSARLNDFALRHGLDSLVADTPHSASVDFSTLNFDVIWKSINADVTVSKRFLLDAVRS